MLKICLVTSDKVYKNGQNKRFNEEDILGGKVFIQLRR